MARVTCVFLNFFTTALAFRSDSTLIRAGLRVRGRVRVGGKVGVRVRVSFRLHLAQHRTRVEVVVLTGPLLLV